MTALARLWRGWEELWFQPMDATRPRWMARLLLGMLALDCWLVMVPHAARYGAGGFNVAHFHWLQALQPLPTADLYVGLMLVCGSLSLLGAFGTLGRLGLGALTVLYTWAWAMSQLDSYQHHYFLTLTLCCLFFSCSVRVDEGDRVRDWGYRMMLVTVAIVYGFTGLSKTEEGWRQGEVLQRIHASGDALAPGLWLGELVGLDEALFWPVAGHLVVVSQVVILLAYLVAGLAPRFRGAGLIRWVGWFVAMAFHLGAEWASLRVGWFSWYMIVIATVALPPLAWSRSLDNALSWFGERLTGGEDPPARSLVVLAVASAALAPLLVMQGLDVPGAMGWGLTWILILPWLVTRARGRRPESSRWHVIGSALAVSISAAVLWVGISSTSVRYDYYRFLGGDTFRRGELSRSHQAYGKANTYAPDGQSRWKKVLRVRKALKRASHEGK